jgi:four helix bundle protein
MATIQKIILENSIIAERLKIKKEFRFAEQMKSAAGSIMDNIAEGFERSSRLEFLNSLSISKGEEAYQKVKPES